MTVDTAAPAPVLRPDWTPSFLKSMRQESDDEADAVADEILARGGAPLVNRAWRLMLSRAAILNDPELAQCPKLQAYLGAAPFLPNGVDYPRLLHGQLFFATWGPLIALGLLTNSLPSSYAAANGVRVIAMTGRLETDTNRRIRETAQILIDALEPHGLDPENAAARGFTTVRHVRLMHAYIRRLLETGYWATEGRNVSGWRRVRAPFYRPSQGAWNRVAWGRPINQEDLAGTLMSFAYLPIVSVRKGPDPDWVDQQGVEAWIYAWTIVGQLLGVDDRLLPRSEAEARELYELIAHDEHKGSPQGRSMTRALVRELEMR
ncbi:MAG: oxygenase MpaB family protein, partial [Tepidiformaceae bacterium]